MLYLRALCIEKNLFATIVGVHVALNATLRVEQEVVVPVIQRKILNVVRDHSIEPSRTVFAANADLAAPSQVIDSAGFGDRGQLGIRACRKVRSRLRPGILGETGAAFRELVS